MLMQLRTVVFAFSSQSGTISMNNIVLCLTCLLSFSASAATLKCTTPMPAKTPASALAIATKVSMQQARSNALAHLKTKSLRIVSEELEIEQGCLVYSFDIEITGKSGIEEIFVDAGDGKVLLQKHETAKQEAAEKAGKTPSAAQ